MQILLTVSFIMEYLNKLKTLCHAVEDSFEDGEAFQFEVTPDVVLALIREIEAARNLLAVAHRDGGHHFNEHGLKSYKDAEGVFHKLRSE